MTKDLKEITIDEVARIPFFSDLPDEYLNLLAERLEIYHYDKDKFVFKEGDIQDSMFFITEGSVIVLKNTESGSLEQLAQFNAPQVIGEMALITPGRRSASIKTITPVTVVRFACAAFEKIVKAKPDLAINILRKAGNTVSTRLRKTNQTYVKVIQEQK